MLHEDPSPQISGAGDALQRRKENKDNMHSSQHTKAKENKDSPSLGGASGGTEAKTPCSVHLEWTFCILPLRPLLKEIVIFLLLQLPVILFNLPVGFFHIVIHELVHEWVKISLVTKEIDKLGAIIKVACR